MIFKTHTEKTKKGNKKMENQTKKEENNEIIEVDNKKYCTACGAKLHEESAMCPSCGTMQEATVPVTEEKGINVFKKIISKIKEHKKLSIICSSVLLVIIGIIVTVSVISYRSSLEYIVKTVKDEYPRAHCIVSYNGMSVTIDTNPEDETTYDIYNMTTTELIVFQSIQSGSTNAIKLMNEKLGFDSDLFDKMNNTSSYAGEQTVENDNYKVKWSYSASKGLEVTYYEK